MNNIIQLIMLEYYVTNKFRINKISNKVDYKEIKTCNF